MIRVILFLFVLSSALFSQFFSPGDIVSVSAVADHDRLTPGASIRGAVVLTISPGLHINSHQPTEAFYIPTQIKLDPHPNLLFGSPQYPKPLLKKFSFSPNRLSVFEGLTVIIFEIKAAPDLKADSVAITGTVSYQGCNDSMCFPPEEKRFILKLPVGRVGEQAAAINADLFSSFPPAIDLTAEEQSALDFVERGFFAALVAFFLIGLALNLTPCVYPVIPLTVAFFGGRNASSKGRTFLSALFYLLGIALSFSALGLLSGLAGKQWGFLFASPWFVVGIAVIILLMAASLFGAFEITVPSWLLTRIGKSKEGQLGSLVMGLTAGVVIAPCAAGVLVGLVGLVAKLGLVLKGAAFFFAMGIGLGLPYLFLAMFSGLTSKLPQSGGWMLWVRKIFAFLLIGVAIYFLLPQLERVPGKQSFLFGITALTAGFLLGFLEHGFYSKGFNRFRKIAGLLLIAYGLFAVDGGLKARETRINWTYYNGQSIESLLAEGKPVFIDFYADWCAPCKQLDRRTFSDPQVAELAESFVMLKVDCTQPNERVKSLMQQFQVSGMPTLVFLSKSGKELIDLREIGFIPPEKFILSMKKALAEE
ncbi:MAG: thioredoxin family protein [candidate division KSB1 bacterium]|nr:thioredoxin family protein [candidate division KSB1 bacterium]